MVRPAWRDYRIRRGILIFLLVGFLPCAPFATALVSVASILIFGIDQYSAQYFAPFIALSWMLAYATAGHRFANFPCPRCGLKFFRVRRMYVPWTNECQHCGWKKWREFDAAIDPGIPSPIEERVECLECGARMQGDLDTCKECGWCYGE